MVAHTKLLQVLLMQISIWLVTSQDVIPLTLGLDFQRAYKDEDILRGFKLNIADGENPLKNHVFDGNIVASPFSTSNTKSAVITSIDDVIDTMEIKGSLSVSYGPLISGSGAGSYLESKVKSKRQISVLYRTRRVAYAKSVDVKTLVPIAGLDKIPTDEITELYGSKFIDQILYGAQLDVIYTIESEEDADFLEIEAELKGKIGVGPFSLEFEANFQKQEGSSRSRYTMQIEARASGIAFDVPSNPTFEQVNTLIDNFNVKYREMLQENADGTNVFKEFSPVAFGLSPIAEYLPSKLSLAESARFDDKMEDLRDVFYHALFAKSQLSKIRDEQELLHGADPRQRIEIFQPYDNVVNDVTAELDSKIDECLDFRMKSVREILDSLAKVPDKYATSEAKVNVLKGLRGEAYLPSPVTISGIRFESFHYIGFALPSNSAFASSDSSSLVPWMDGVLRRDNDNSVVASADTPEDLAQLGLDEISPGTGHNYLKYDDKIFLQSASVDYRWLKIGSHSVKTKDYFADAVEANYQWHVMSQVGDLSGGPDPKQGQCIKYGDIAFFNADGVWLHQREAGTCDNSVTANCAGGGCCANTVSEGFDTARLRWRIRSTIGTGSLDAENNPDPASGQCIQLLSKIYLQSNSQGSRWLTGSRSAGNELVLSFDILSDDYELRGHKSYEWMALKEHGDGLTANGFHCPAATARGKWAPTQPINGVNYEIGIDRATDFPYWEQNSSWDDSVTASITGGFKFGSVGIDIRAKEMEASVRDVLHDPSFISDDSIGSGQVWQFVYEISDACAPLWHLKTKDLVVTTGADKEPCCLPGQELDASQPHGPCKLRSPCQCEISVCYQEAPTSPPPTSFPTTSSAKDTGTPTSSDKDTDPPTTSPNDTQIDASDGNSGNTIGVPAAGIVLPAVSTILLVAAALF